VTSVQTTGHDDIRLEQTTTTDTKCQ